MSIDESCRPVVVVHRPTPKRPPILIDEIMSTSVIPLPLKKRLCTTFNDAPVDFSLPNRVRAQLSSDSGIESSSSSSSSSSSDSGDFESIQLRPPDQLRLALAAAWSSPLLHQHLLHAALYPALIIPAAKIKTDDEEDELKKASSSSPVPVKVTTTTTNYVINPATGNKVRRNYKNTTKERRSEANARERTRVHTIGASFEQLRQLLPTGSEPKLSKLSILRIACQYILLLGAACGRDYSEDQRAYSVDECIDMLNDTMIAECKLKQQHPDRR